ncbi:hypothetical protein NPIL_125161 [Nephila pilipes]|uniref:Uncharacterized protein n=1 Tax=Nephila pilipes TaxID=299642 RepID=A0A8X6TGM5_NEPPI|nr:hypothetical protein NPIL_125161 [Nephila pilipes]
MVGIDNRFEHGLRFVPEGWSRSSLDYDACAVNPFAFSLFPSIRHHKTCAILRRKLCNSYAPTTWIVIGKDVSSDRRVLRGSFEISPPRAGTTVSVLLTLRSRSKFYSSKKLFRQKTFCNRRTLLTDDLYIFTVS